MKLNHLDLAVADTDAMQAFLETFFDFHCASRAGNGRLVVMKGEDGFTLVLSPQHEHGAQSYPDGFHFGFLVDEVAAVHAMHERLRDAGFDVGRGVMPTRRGTLLYVHGPCGLLCEVSCYGTPVEPARGEVA